MLSRTVKRSLIGTRWAAPFQCTLPIRALITTSSNQETRFFKAEASNATLQPPKSTVATTKTTTTSSSTCPLTPSNVRKAPSKPSQLITDATLDPSIPSLLPLLRAQPPHFMTAHIHGRTYLITEGDTVRLPFLMPGVSMGDVLRLNRATLLGSRDYTIKAPSLTTTIATTTEELTDQNHQQQQQPKTKRQVRYIDERLFVCRARVVGVETEPLRFKIKTKARQRHIRRIASKHRSTVLRITQLTVRSSDELDQEVPEPE